MTIQTSVFDAYGTLFDVHPIGALAETLSWVIRTAAPLEELGATPDGTGPDIRALLHFARKQVGAAA